MTKKHEWEMAFANMVPPPCAYCGRYPEPGRRSCPGCGHIVPPAVPIALFTSEKPIAFLYGSPIATTKELLECPELLVGVPHPPFTKFVT